MKRPITLITLTALAALNAACAEENGGAQPSGIAQTAGTSTAAFNSSAAAAVTRKNGGLRETGTTRTTVTLMATPHSDARSAGQLAANTPVDILERRGGWLRLAAAGQSGWARLHQVRVGTGPGSAKSGAGLAILKNVGETGRSGSQGVVATTGIRGLSAEELRSAKPNPAAVKAIAAWRANASQAREYARAAKLKEAGVPYLPPPE